MKNTENKDGQRLAPSAPCSTQASSLEKYGEEPPKEALPHLSESQQRTLNEISYGNPSQRRTRGLVTDEDPYKRLIQFLHWAYCLDEPPKKKGSGMTKGML